jgi:hypothetical protein
LQGEYLYLKPDIGDTWFATTNTTQYVATDDPFYSLFRPSGTLVDNDLDFSSGFRVGAFYAFCECPLEIRGLYTRLTSSNSKAVEPQDGLNPSSIYPQAETFVITQPPNPSTRPVSSTSSIHLTYQRGDALIAKEIYSLPCEFILNTFGGLEVVQIDLEEEYSVRSSPGGLPSLFRPNYIQDFFAIGPKLGFESKYSPCWPLSCERFIPQCLSFVSSGSFSLLAARSRPKTTVYEEFRASPLSGEIFISNQISNTSNWRVSWAAHLQLGVSIEKAISCVHSVFEVGYELDFYNQALNRKNYANFGVDRDVSGVAPSFRQDFSLQGLYFCGKFSF